MASPLESPPPPSGPVGTPGSASSPPPTLASLSGGGPAQPPDASLQIVTQHLMEAEQALQAAAKIKPELSGVVATFINSVKPAVGQILFGGGTGPQPGALPAGGAAPAPGSTMGPSPGMMQSPGPMMS